MRGKILFKEEQTFVGTWIFYLVLGIVIIAIIGTILPLLMNGGKEQSMAGVIIGTLSGAGVICLLSFSKLRVTIDEHAIYYQYPPFIVKKKKLIQADIKDLHVRTYQPIREYGCWGYRIRPGGRKALNVSGNKGLQLTLANGKDLLIGTQRPEAINHAVKRLKENWGMDG